jgi:hypothetical protein
MLAHNLFIYKEKLHNTQIYLLIYREPTVNDLFLTPPLAPTTLYLGWATKKGGSSSFEGHQPSF